MSALRDKHEEYRDMEDRWSLVDALFEGEHGVHEEGEKYIPRLQDEDDRAYKLRLKMTPVFGAFPRTVLGLRGMMFRKPMKVEVPQAIAHMMNDIDLAGTTLQGLSQEVVEDALVYGRIGLLVDYPQTIPNATKADAAALNYRPMIVKYDAEAIYNWRPERINGVTVTSQVRLEEEKEVQDPEDEFKIKCEKRYRVIDLFDGKYRQRVFKIVDNVEVIEDEFFPQMNGKPLTYIPFVVIGVDGLGLEVKAPPLIDLATTVLHHTMQATSYERGVFFSGLPTMFISGINNENADGTAVEISIGGNLANILPRPDAKAYYVEVAGEFNALRTNLEDKKREMAVLGARMIEPTRQGNPEAAETVARRMSGEESLLSIMAQTVSIGLTQAVQWFSEWAGATGDVKVDLNRDFVPAGITLPEMTALIGAWQSGAISQETMFDNLKAGEVIADDVDFETEQERIGSAGLSLTAGNPSLTPPVVPEPVRTDPLDTSAIDAAIATLTEQHQTMFDQLLQAIEALKQPVAAAPPMQHEPDTGMKDMIQVMGDRHAEGMAAIADAMAVQAPAPIVNVAAQPAPIVNIAPAAVNVAAPVINMPEQPITINMPEQQPANVTVNNLPPEGKKAITVERDASGKIIGAKAE